MNSQPYTDRQWAQAVVIDWHKPDVAFPVSLVEQLRLKAYSSTPRIVAAATASDFELVERSKRWLAGSRL